MILNSYNRKKEKRELMPDIGKREKYAMAFHIVHLKKSRERVTASKVMI